MRYTTVVIADYRGNAFDKIMKVGTSLFILFFVSFLASGNAFANGGNIRIAEGKYFINISSSPVTPVAGQKVAMLIAFASVEKNELITQNIRTWIEIRTKGGEKVIFPSQEFLAQRGILEFEFTYPEPGLHELFVRFEKPDEPGKIYESEDFLVDVQPSKEHEAALRSRFLWLLVALPLGALIGFGLGKRYR